MRILKTLGECPNCSDQLELHMTKSRKRFVKCANLECDTSYAIPAYGSVEYMGLHCPKTNFPILMITKKSQNVQYFWVDGPCFTCRKGTSCEPIVELREEFEMEVNH